MLRLSIILATIFLVASSSSLMAATTDTMVHQDSTVSKQTDYRENKKDKSPVCKRNSIFLEWGAASNGFGIGYEHRLSSKAQLYLRTGFGYGTASYGDNYILTLPLGATWLLGKRRSKLELGAGAAYSYEHLSAGGVKEDSSFLNFYGNVGWR
jgi:hypothetical protein